MNTIYYSPSPGSSLRFLMALLAAFVLSACASTGPSKTGPVETQDDGGFTIVENVDIGKDLRADFDAAVVLMQQEQYEQGIALLERVAVEAPGVTAVHIDLGIAYRHTGDLERAEASLQRALEINPRHPVIHNELGMLYRKSGRFEEARASYERALALQPGFHYARRNLAILCDVYLADLSCALENYEVYIEAVPNDEEATIWVADIRNRID
jgi:tetratricopeptide (TPR) repeat protein